MIYTKRSSVHGMGVFAGRVIHPFEGIPIELLSNTNGMNHSCEPNCFIDGDSVFATRQIMFNEELTVDYHDTTFDRLQPCNCQPCNIEREANGA
jgi:hypothetical protein